jgi:predicted DNA-binding protein (MmcQ/YjbR family)
MPSKNERVERALRDKALSFPQTTEEFPWGERAIKVRGKVFLFMYGADGELKLSVKLPQSADAALLLPFCEPTGYGLGKSGWVSASFGKKDNPPLDMLLEWLEESFRAVAPKKIAALLDAGDVATVVTTKRKTKPAAKAKKKKQRRSRT